METVWNSYDEPIWEILRQPKHKVTHISGGVSVRSFSEEIPYPLEEVAKQVGRCKVFVRLSLKRLEKRGKVKDVHGGWQRKER